MKVLALCLGLLFAGTAWAHGGGLNKCGCHVKHATGECHCHQDRGCGCSCQPAHCPSLQALPGDDRSDVSFIVVAKGTHVKGYTKKDGTYVAPHHRSSPNHTKTDNYSSKGSTNPYTGKEGTRDPEAPSPPPKR